MITRLLKDVNHLIHALFQPNLCKVAAGPEFGIFGYGHFRYIFFELFEYYYRYRQQPFEPTTRKPKGLKVLFPLL